MLETSDDGNWLTALNEKGLLSLVDVQQNAIVAELGILDFQDSRIASLAASNDGKLILSGSEAGELRAWKHPFNADARVAIHTDKAARIVDRIQISPDQKWVLVNYRESTHGGLAGENRALGNPQTVLFRVDEKLAVQARYPLRKFHAPKFSSDSQWLVARNFDVLDIWNLSKEDPIESHRALTYLPKIESLREAAKRLASPETESLLARDKPLRGHAAAISISAGSRLVAVGHHPLWGGVLVWELNRLDTGPKYQLLGNSASIHSTAISSDERLVAAGIQNGNILIWDLDKPNPSEHPFVLRGHSYSCRVG